MPKLTSEDDGEPYLNTNITPLPQLRPHVPNMSIIRDSYQQEEESAYEVDETVLSESAFVFAHEQGIPDEIAVDKVLTHPDAYELHMKLDSVDPIKVVEIGEHKALKSGGGAKPENTRFNTDTVTWWTSIRFDCGIGITDVVCMEDVVLDVSRRSGEAGSRYLIEYANVGIPLSLSSHLLHRIADMSLYAVSYKNNSVHDRHMWINVNMVEGIRIKSLQKTEQSDEEGTYEGLSLTPVPTQRLLDSPSRSMACNMFFTLGNSLTLSRSVDLSDIPNTTPSTVTMKMVGLHVTQDTPNSNPVSISRGKKY